MQRPAIMILAASLALVPGTLWAAAAQPAHSLRVMG